MKMVQKPRKSLVAFAIASAIGGAAFVSPAAHAVNISPDGLGDVQIFPYYTVRNGYDTYVHLTNTSANTVAVKIRFREAKNSREVRDFNVVLSPRDVWTAAVTASGQGAKLVTFDKSCTSPLLSASTTSPGATEIDFTSIGYDGSSADYFYDNGGTTIERTQEGYFEVIAMGASSLSTSTSSNIVEFNAKHVNGVPRDCSKVNDAFNGAFGTELTTVVGPFSSGWSSAGNVLKGFSTLINVATGQAVEGEPTTLANFSDVTNIYTPGDLLPDLGSGTAPGVAQIFTDNSLAPVVSFVGAAPIDNVSALLMRNNVINEFTSTTTGSTLTDWVLTFPTKHNYVDDGGKNEHHPLTTPSVVGITAELPFDEVFTKNTNDLTNNTGKSCVEIGLARFDREEKTVASGTVFSPRSSSGRTELCNEVNVVTFNSSKVLGSSVEYNISTADVGLSGWVNMTLGVAATEGRLDGINGTSLGGLPVIGFAAVVRNNNSEAGNNRNYGVSEQHSYQRNFAPKAVTLP